MYELISSSVVFIVACVVIGVSTGLIVRSARPKNNTLKAINFNPDIISGFDAWLARSISMYMIRYIEDRSAKEMVRDGEISITSEFGVNGIEYVTRLVLSNIPNYYQAYMIEFYGEDKMVVAIHDKVRSIFMEYISKQIKRRSTPDDSLQSMVR